MQSFIYLTIALVAFTAAKQLNVGPQVLSEPQSSSVSSQNPEKRYITQEYTFYLTPDEIKALQGIQNIEKSENPENTQTTKERQSEPQNEAEQQLNRFSTEAPQFEIRGITATHDAFFQNQKSESENQQRNYKYNNFYLEEQPKEQKKEMQSFPAISKANLENYFNWQKEQEKNSQQESDLQNDAKWKPYLTATNQVPQLNEQLKQQWNRILDHNREQLKSLSPMPEPQESKQKEKSEEQWNSKFEIEKEIENILRDHRAYEFAKQSGNSQAGQAEAINQRLPILIHKEVSVTKHLPVTVVKNVNVPVPKPVLVPVPQPYEVKIPHPYPVPLHILQQAPVPYLRNQRNQ